MTARNVEDSQTATYALPPGTPPAPGSELDRLLREFQETHSLRGKGQIATMVYASRLAREAGLPFDTANGIRTEGEGQVKGLGKASVQRVLACYGITTVLAEEGGRTSRKSLFNIRAFLEFLNELRAKGNLDIAAVEAWWVQEASAFFNAKPFALRFEAGKSLRAVFRDLMGQAKAREAEAAGTKVVGAMLQHLVGAKLGLAMRTDSIVHHGFSVADAPGGRSGDFEIGQASIHVTTAPGEAVFRKCRENLRAGRHPIVVTTYEMLPIADYQAREIGIADSVDVLDAEQFIVANLHELGGFKADQRRVTVEALVDEYNRIVGAHETDPSLKISRG